LTTSKTFKGRFHQFENSVLLVSIGQLSHLVQTPGGLSMAGEDQTLLYLTSWTSKQLNVADEVKM
jgi:hypothetical protein